MVELSGAARAPRFFVWRVTETAGYESAWVELDRLTLRASGRVAGQLPEPYWLSYTLDTDESGATTRLDVTATIAQTEHRLELRRGEDGWTVDGEPRPDLAGALDCDLAGSPLTNTMPIIRHRLHKEPGTEQFLMAFVVVPSLHVIAAQQLYEHLERVEAGARVRYSSGDFSSDLVVDDNGFVLDYPTMAHRIPIETSVTRRERAGGPGSPRPSTS